MRVIPPMLAGLMALAAPSVQAAPNPNENWRPLSTVLSFELTEDEACGVRRTPDPTARLARSLVVGSLHSQKQMTWLRRRTPQWF